MEWQVRSFALLVSHSWCFKTKHTYGWRGFSSLFRQSFGRHWKRFSLFLPLPAPYNYRTAGETVGLWICLNSMSAPRSETRPLEFEPAFAFGLSWMKSGEIYSINSSDIARAASCLPRVRARLPACTEIVGLPCLASLLVECRTRDQKKFRVRIPAGTAWEFSSPDLSLYADSS